MKDKENKKDAVCGMDLETGESLHHQHEGTDYHFYSKACLDEFKADPGKYVSKEAELSYGAAEKPIIYTCPAGHEVEGDEGGDCPECGSAMNRKDK
ncbi:MAG: YHS domain-containing protein [Actinomycetota bacterium]|nr:YHS domain-containing protein [Actinomycetota bacterium]